MSINTITPLTAQQVFDAALFGIRTQGYVKSYRVSRGCAYRGEHGLKCGIGHAIPDACYNPLFDSSSHSTIIGELLDNSRKQFDVLRRLFGGVPVYVLEDIQAAHDEMLATYPSEDDKQRWEQRMEDIAVAYGLTYTPVAEA